LFFVGDQAQNPDKGKDRDQANQDAEDDGEKFHLSCSFTQMFCGPFTSLDKAGAKKFHRRMSETFSALSGLIG
jgi:hypothetical protein